MACFHVSMLANHRGRWTIAPLHCTVGLCKCQPWLYPHSCQTQGQFGNCLCAGHGTCKGTTMQTLRAYRAPKEALGPGEGCTCICTNNSSSSPWSWSSTASASQWTSITRGKRRSVKLTSWHTGHPEVIPCQQHTQLLEARAYCSSWTHKVPLTGLAQSLPNLTAGPFLSGYYPLTTCL